MNTQIIPVPFHQDVVVLVDDQGAPHVAMRPVVENMGLDWRSQHVKLTEKFASVVVMITTTGADGKQYEMVCLPLRKLPAWLYSINPAKVAPELRETIVRYQEECDDALWAYWNQGVAIRHGAAPTIGQQLSAHGMRLKLMNLLEKETGAAKRLAVHQQLDHVSRILGLPTPRMDAIGKTHEQPRLF